jgi:hypothetical protein
MSLTERFTCEAQTIAQLNHPNIRTLHDAGPNYLVMEVDRRGPASAPVDTPKLSTLSWFSSGSGCTRKTAPPVSPFSLKPRVIYQTAVTDRKDYGEYPASAGRCALQERTMTSRTSSLLTKTPHPGSGLTPFPRSVFRQFSGVRVGGLTLPMPPSPTGGDSVGAVPVGHGFISFIMDGQGKGLMASRLGALMHECVLTTIAAGTRSPEGILRILNRTLIGEQKLGAATILRLDGSRLTAAAAGAPAPALFFSDGTMERIPVVGTILGATSCPDFDVCSREIPTSAFVAIFSDGVTEAESPEGVFFDPEQFGNVLDGGRSLAANLLHCVDAVLHHCGTQQDDLSMLIVRAEGLGAAHVPESSQLRPHQVQPGRNTAAPQTGVIHFQRLAPPALIEIPQLCCEGL